MSAARSLAAAAVFLGLLVTAASAGAQAIATVRVTHQSVVMEQPRGDSLRIGMVQPGDEYEVLATSGSWVQVTAGDRGAAGKGAWTRGWIHAGAVEVIGALPRTAERPRAAPGRLRVRAFGQAGGTLFTARNSFETILGSAFGAVSGGGVQVVLPNDVFVQVSTERFRETGERVLVDGGQLFTLESDADVAVTPVLVTLGFRSREYSRMAPYVGFGVGWHQLREDWAGVEVGTHRKIGYHVLGGIEYPLGRWVALGGEAQWATVPKALGDSGISAVYDERNLGGTSFRFKLIVGN
jgi:hypothetical protein